MSDNDAKLNTIGGYAPAPKWIQEMHGHVQRTGHYRSEDITRVLGDPSECVEVRALNELQLASRAILER